MNSPPRTLVVEMSSDDVQDNIVNIIESMERIRQESIVNLGATDEQKMDYLRLTGELASCLKQFVRENQLDMHIDAVKGIVNSDLLLRNYDSLQPNFWNARAPNLGTALDDCTAVLLRDDFVNENQKYHVFQALKYLSLKDNERDDVYETILPVNSLLNEHGLSSPDISSYLMRGLLSRADDSTGIRANIDAETLVKRLQQAGALFVDIPKEFYNSIKKEFPKTILVEENRKQYARVVFGTPETKQAVNLFRRLEEYAQLDLEDSEENLVRKMSNFYSFGKKFLKQMKERIGVKEDKEIQTGLESRADIILDEAPADNGKKKTQDKWFEYWSKVDDGSIMASMPDLYECFKNLKTGYENGTDDEKAKAQELLDSLRDDFDWPGQNNWLIASTRISYLSDSLDAKIKQHYKCNKSEFIEEKDIVVPVYRGTLITQVVNDADGLVYLQTLFDTKDDGEKIMQTMEFISGKNRNSIKIWTPNQDTRKTYPERAAGLSYGGGGFRVVGLDLLVDSGRSRRVFINPRSGG